MGGFFYVVATAGMVVLLGHLLNIVPEAPTLRASLGSAAQPKALWDFLERVGIRNSSLACAAFGLAGGTLLIFKAPALVALGLAIAVGYGAAKGAALVQHAMHAPEVVSEADYQRAIGETARVIQTIPAQRHGSGHIRLFLPDRSFEMEASTAGDELPEGCVVKVKAVARHVADVVALTDEDETTPASPSPR